MDANNETDKPDLANNQGKPRESVGDARDSRIELDEHGRPTKAQRQKDGRKGLLFSIEMLYYESSRSNELKRHAFRNLYWSEVTDIRENCVAKGIMFGISPSQWRLILPQNIDLLQVERQREYVEH